MKVIIPQRKRKLLKIRKKLEQSPKLKRKVWGTTKSFNITDSLISPLSKSFDFSKKEINKNNIFHTKVYKRITIKKPKDKQNFFISRKLQQNQRLHYFDKLPHSY